MLLRPTIKLHDILHVLFLLLSKIQQVCITTTFNTVIESATDASDPTMEKEEEAVCTTTSDTVIESSSSTTTDKSSTATTSETVIKSSTTTTNV